MRVSDCVVEITCYVCRKPVIMVIENCMCARVCVSVCVRKYVSGSALAGDACLVCQKIGGNSLSWLL